MARISFESVPEYLAAQPRPAQAVLKKVRAIIRKALPKAEEGISYQIPAYKLDGQVVIYFAGFKQHFSLYPATGLVAEVLAREIAPYKVSEGTLRFALTEPLPVKLIERVVKLRAKEAGKRGQAAFGR